MEDCFKLLNGVRVHYRIGGENSAPGAHTLVLMHGWGCNVDTLASIERVALSCGCRVVNIDFPGFGQSEEPEGIWGVDDYTDMLRQLIEAEQIDRPVLLGHSFGGRVAIIYAARYADEVSKLILVDAAGVKPRRTFTYYRKVYTFKAGRRALETILGKKNATPIVDRWRARRGSSDYSGASPKMRAIMSRVVNQDLCSLMPDIKAPTLLIWGEDDTATPVADARKMAKLIHNAGLVTFPGCGHYSFLDNPVQFAAVIRSFLSAR